MPTVACATGVLGAERPGPDGGGDVLRVGAGVLAGRTGLPTIVAPEGPWAAGLGPLPTGVGTDDDAGVVRGDSGTVRGK